MKTALTRRKLLQLSGMTALSIPLLRTLLECDEAVAAVAQGSSRALFIYYPDGNLAPLFFPKNPGRITDLPSISGPLLPFKDKLSMVRGLEYLTTGSHEGGAAFCLTGSTNKSKLYSIDNYLGDRLGDGFKYKSLRLGVGANFQSGAEKYISYLSSGAIAPVQDNPRIVFNEFYQVPGRSAAEISIEQQRKKSVLDYTIRSLQSIQNQLGAVEKAKLDQHLTALRDMEKSLFSSSSGGGSCGGYLDWRGLEISEELKGYPNVIERNENFETLSEIMADIMVQALQCGVTPVGLLQWSHAVSPTVLNFQSVPTVLQGNASGHHDLSHYGGMGNQSGVEKFSACQFWFMTQLAKVLERLERTKIGDQSLLDQSMVFATTEVGDPDLHHFEDIGCLVVGGASGRHAAGQSLQFSKRSYNHMLITLLHMVGMPQNTFGDGSLGQGPIGELLK